MYIYDISLRKGSIGTYGFFLATYVVVNFHSENLVLDVYVKVHIPLPPEDNEEKNLALNNSFFAYSFCILFLMVENNCGSYAYLLKGLTNKNTRPSH